MASTQAVVEQKLNAALKIEFLEVNDLSDGCGAKIDAIIVSPDFEGKGLLDRQRTVNQILEAEMKSIHAFTMKTWTPAQYEQKKSSLT